MAQIALSPVSLALGGRQRQYLRGLAHGQKMTVSVGQAGLTESVLQAVRESLRDHELIKVRMYQPEDKHATCDALVAGTQSVLCGLVGHTAILYRPHPTTPVITLPG